jgi:hypothetical protein
VSARRNPPVRTYDLARSVAPALVELHRRFVLEEERLAEQLGADDAASVDDFVAWVVGRAGEPPRRPRGSRDRSSVSNARRSVAQRARRARERRGAQEGLASAA